MRKKENKNFTILRIVIAVVAIATCIAYFLVFRKNNSQEEKNGENVVQIEEEKNETSKTEENSIREDLDIVRGTVTKFSTDTIVVKTGEGEKEVRITADTPIYYAQNEQISKSDFGQIKQEAKINIQFDKETSEATSILIEE